MSADINHTPRLFIESALQTGQPVSVSADQAHYVQHVMRMQYGDKLRLFNGRDGEWLGKIGKASKRTLEIEIGDQLKLQTPMPDLWLCCAPIKKAHFDFLIEKATELGVSEIRPILTNRAQVREVNVERVRALAIEAAEQSERLSIPDIHKPVTLKDLLAHWPNDRRLVVCAEWGDAVPVREAFTLFAGKNTKAGIVTGPEGGFEKSEL